MYKRLPEAARLNANVQAAFTVLQHLWGRHYTKLWSCLEWEWPSEVQGLVATMRVRLQEHMMDLVARAYTSVAVSQLANLVGMIEAEARQGEPSAQPQYLRYAQSWARLNSFPSWASQCSCACPWLG